MVSLLLAEAGLVMVHQAASLETDQVVLEFTWKLVFPLHAGTFWFGGRIARKGATGVVKFMLLPDAGPPALFANTLK